MELLLSQIFSIFVSITNSYKMKSIKFNDSELDLLISMYEEELKEAVKYVDVLQNTLSKFKKKGIENKEIVAKPTKKRGRKPSVKVEAAPEVVVESAPKKRGRKSKKAAQEVLGLLTAIEKKKEKKVKAVKSEVPVKAEPKKRGRKPKQILQPLVQMMTKAVEEKPKKAVKKSALKKGTKKGTLKAKKITKVKVEAKPTTDSPLQS